MNVAFYASVGKKFDDTIAEAFRQGCRSHRVSCEIFSTASWETTSKVRGGIDLAVVVGVKDKSAPIFQAYRAAGRHAVFIDKGYTRIRGGDLGTLYWRVSVDDFQPLKYFQKVKRPSDRWDALGVEIVSTRKLDGENILFAGSSQKYCTWQGLGDCNTYNETVLAEIRKLTKRNIVYRPKPSWKDKKPLEGYQYSPPEEKFEVELANAHCLVTYGSNACFEALIAGVPPIVLGDGITRPVCGTSVAAVNTPTFPSSERIYQLAYDLAYCQWTLDEMAVGETWSEIRRVLKEKERA